MGTNAYFFSRLSPIGGIETFLYQLAKSNTDKDITFYYISADLKQLRRLSQYATCEEYYPGKKIVCDKFFCNFNRDPIKNGDVTANEKILVIHGNYDWLGAQYAPRHPDIDRVIAVSQDSADAYERITGIKCEVCYNPLEVDKPNKVLYLMSATRLDKNTENIKGTSRMEKMVEVLNSYCEKNGTDYVWFIFSTSKPFDDPHICWMKPRIVLSGFQNKVDYGIQLSDNVEGFCYTTHEFLNYGVPMVLTPCDTYKECGITDEMALFLDFDCSNIEKVVEDMFTRKLKFAYHSPKTRWGEILAKPKHRTRRKKLKLYTVTATHESRRLRVKIAELDRIANPGETFETTEERVKTLRGENPYRARFIE